jgi:hypothetical protein
MVLMMMDGICSVDPNLVSKNEFYVKREGGRPTFTGKD